MASSTSTHRPASNANAGIGVNATAVISTRVGDQYPALWREAVRKFEEQTRSAKTSRRKVVDKLLQDLEGCDRADQIMAILGQGGSEADSAKNANPKWRGLRDDYLLPVVQVISFLFNAVGDVVSVRATRGYIAQVY